MVARRLCLSRKRIPWSVKALVQNVGRRNRYSVRPAVRAARCALDRFSRPVVGQNQGRRTPPVDPLVNERSQFRTTVSVD